MNELYIHKWNGYLKYIEKIHEKKPRLLRHIIILDIIIVIGQRYTLIY